MLPAEQVLQVWLVLLIALGSLWQGGPDPHTRLKKQRKGTSSTRVQAGHGAVATGQGLGTPGDTAETQPAALGPGPAAGSGSGGSGTSPASSRSSDPDSSRLRGQPKGRGFQALWS